MADISVQFYVYRNQNIRGILLDKIYNYHTVLVEAYNIAMMHKQRKWHEAQPNASDEASALLLLAIQFRP